MGLLTWDLPCWSARLLCRYFERTQLVWAVIYYLCLTYMDQGKPTRLRRP